ncbi:MAG: hypothetical protein L0323_22185 [Planctomycetes bacterium]|nr:hypothetical protein [Planctomycetota bacterium]
MRTFPILLVPFLSILGSAAGAQECAPLLPSGQPGLPFFPTCVGTVPPPVVWAAGNAGFGLAAAPLPPPVPPGVPTFLVLSAPIAPFPVPCPPLHPAFGCPGLVVTPVLLVVPSGLSSPVGGPAVAFPIPPTGAALGLVLAVQTIALIPAGALPPGGAALTHATGITI